MHIYHLSIHYKELILEMSGYKDANYELFNIKTFGFDWSCFHQGTVNEAISLFTIIFIEFAQVCIPS